MHGPPRSGCSIRRPSHGAASRQGLFGAAPRHAPCAAVMPLACLRRLAGHGHHAHCVLWVVLRLGAGQQVDRVGLRLEARRRIIAVARELAVVHAHHRAVRLWMRWRVGRGGKGRLAAAAASANEGGGRQVGTAVAWFGPAGAPSWCPVASQGHRGRQLSTGGRPIRSGDQCVLPQASGSPSRPDTATQVQVH